MSRPTFLALLFVVLFPVLAFAEIDSLPAKYLSLGPKKAGICFGNSPVYTGFRFNFMNRKRRRTNGFDLVLLNDEKLLGTSNGISSGVVANVQYQNNGIAIGGLMNAVDHENGIMLGSLYSAVNRLNGIGVGGAFVCDTVNGLAIAPMALGKWVRDTVGGRINGVALSILATSTGKLNGVAIAAQNYSKEHKGLAIGAYNNTEKLKGIQIGLYNVALNNPKGLRRLPLVNMHFGK